MYNHNLIEKKWQKYWLDNKTYKFVNDSKLPKAYILDMFPYPSGQGLHVGHPRGYTATDIYSRYKRFNGFNVLHPIGWDAFGLPAEQFAIKSNKNPRGFTEENIKHFRTQLQSLGFSYDYDKEVDTTDPKYYKWTQWIFSKLFEKGLAEIKDVDVNWCEKLGTVLANEEVLNIDGHMVSERGNFPVVRKPMRQWVLKITKYADVLVEDLDLVKWPEHLRSIQRKWIGRSTGALVTFKTENNDSLEVFTTRPDTIYGVTFIALAPEHKQAQSFITPEHKTECEKYINDAKSKSEFDRKIENKDQTGVFTGSYATNPIDGKKVPIYICDYVLINYATGALMGVPAHDERDWSFAKKYNLPIIFVLEAKDESKPFIDDAKHINSDIINGLNKEEATNKIIEKLEKDHTGKKEVCYKLKDWLFSRQRYWGEPFPVVFDEKNEPHLVKELPLELPDCEDFKPSADGHSPLAKLTSWVNLPNGYKRETNTMPNWAGSCWYYLGYLMKQEDGSYLPLDSKEAYKLFERWLPVDTYVGGQEHAVLHLLYSRFWHHFLYDIGVVPTKEPFYTVVNQGMILGPNGVKMSKSLGNVINPDDVVKSHGADALRLYEMFMGPLNSAFSWTEEGLNGVRKWLDRVYRFFEEYHSKFGDKSDENLNHAYNVFVKNVTRNIDSFGFNVAISDMMMFINACYNAHEWSKEQMINFIVVLSCFAPHVAEELYQMVGGKESVTKLSWPTYDEKLLFKSTFNLPVMINGKLRDVVVVKTDAEEADALEAAKKSDKVTSFINGKQIKKVIYVKNKILNLII
ncbi:MAG: leucine--tRNA ligase [Malacoplasma sp.]|nr:leucine--tRNA ligase [Malacoplasma sp.]